MTNTGISWITGASHGIGRALAERLALDGVAVAVSARSANLLLAMQAQNRQLLPYPLDVTDPVAVDGCVDRIDSEIGLPQRVILNAGIYEPAPLAVTSAASFRQHMQVNYLGVTNCIAAILPRMLARGSGQLVIVASVAGYRGLPQGGAYGPTKAALINLAETLRLECAGSGVDVRLVNPGFVDTRLTAKNTFRMPAIQSTEAAAEQILDGLDGERFEIAFPGRFVFWLKLARLLPWGLYSHIVKRMTQHERP